MKKRENRLMFFVVIFLMMIFVFIIIYSSFINFQENDSTKDKEGFLSSNKPFIKDQYQIPPELPFILEPDNKYNNLWAKHLSGVPNTYGGNFVLPIVSSAIDNPLKIILNWSISNNNYIFEIYRKNISDITFNLIATLPSNSTYYEDTNIELGKAYEYKISASNSSPVRLAYIYSGVNVSLPDSRGKIILIIENTTMNSLEFELRRLELDLIGDGWSVIKHNVSRSDNVSYVKSLIMNDYLSDPDNVNAIFLFGNVPVPYSGNLAPDGHGDHMGAWPADIFYADTSNDWSDVSVDVSNGKNTNIPYDGRYDQNYLPSRIKIMIGRVDLSKMTLFSKNETELLRQYLGKDHNFRTGITKVAKRALVSDHFTSYSEGFSQTGWRLSSLVGIDNVSSGEWDTDLINNDYLFSYGCGGGNYNGASGISNTKNYSINIYLGMFQILFGSYFGDWDNSNNFLRAPLALPNYGLTNVWAGRPNWFFHYMGLGEPIGKSIFISSLNDYIALDNYNLGYSGGEIHVALMGDPTLRMEYLLPPTNFTIQRKDYINITLNWNASQDSVIGYHIYRSISPEGPFTRITPDLINQLSYNDSFYSLSSVTYMIRAISYVNSYSGSYFNPSQGVFYTINSSCDSFDSDCDGVNDSVDKCSNTYVINRDNVNLVGCPIPNITNFDIISNLSYSDLNNVSNFQIGIQNYSKISYLSNVSLIKYNNGTGDIIDLNSNINMTYNRLEVNSSALVELNVSANITFYKTGLIKPLILLNGLNCSDCVILYFNNISGELIFNITHFSIFEAIEEPICGDNVCSIWIESCTTCSKDCGACNLDPGNLGSSNYNPNTALNKSCIPSWNCSLNKCENELVERNCIDLNKCNKDNFSYKEKIKCSSDERILTYESENDSIVNKESPITKFSISYYSYILFAVLILIIIIIYFLIMNLKRPKKSFNIEKNRSTKKIR